jgi:hypothetical protein
MSFSLSFDESMWESGRPIPYRGEKQDPFSSDEEEKPSLEAESGSSAPQQEPPPVFRSQEQMAIAVHSVALSAIAEQAPDIDSLPPMKVRRLLRKALPLPVLPEPPEQAAAAADPFTPKKRFRAEERKGRVVVLPTPKTKQKMREEGGFLYSFKMDEWKTPEGLVMPAKRYIGYSESGAGRLALHIFGFNHSEEEGSQFYRDVSEHPERLSWGIIRFLKPGEDSKTAETEAILAKKSKEKETGYNIRLGGGGGKSHKKEDQKCEYSIPQIVSMIRETYQSPAAKDMMRISRIRKGVRREAFKVTLAKEDSSVRNVIYDFFIEKSEKKEDRQHHIGATGGPFSKRVAEHMSGVNNPDTKAGKGLPFYQTMRENPTRVRIRRFNVDELLAKGIPLSLLEKAFMQYFIERGEEVENEGHGGKGPTPQTL